MFHQKFCIFVLIAGFSFINFNNVVAQDVQNMDIARHSVILKVKESYREGCFYNLIKFSDVERLFMQIGVIELNRKFPTAKLLVSESKSNGRFVDLSLIYQLKYSNDLEETLVCNLLFKTGYFEYVEPNYINTIHYVPNDPSLGSQYFLTKINAINAWNINKGDTNTVIGIIDTGTDWDHPDLQSNIKYNYADPINGFDDDNDGFVDNYRGWDLSDNDNNPMCGFQNHGSHVSGCAAGSTDNSIGVASPGFNCKFLPVKAAKNTSSNSIDNGYEGIVYAADHGCTIINCSWGGPGGGQFAQDVINYATYNKGALVVASAGNNSNSNKQYPAALDNVLAVASTNSADFKSNFSSYGGFVDLCAPGSGIYSTYQNDTYASLDGTSMSSPIAAGCAAIVKSQFPSYSGFQCGEQLRVTSDNIYSIGPNGTYQNQLGTGRINLYRALTENPPSVRYTDINYFDLNDNSFIINDTVRITGKIRNYLAPTTNLVLTLTSTNTNVQILNNTVTVGVLGTLDSTDNFITPFTIKVMPGTPQNTVVDLKLNMTDGTYSDFQMLSITVNVDYINVTINKVFTTITSKGRIGYNQDGQMEGIGFDYYHATGNENLMYDGGLLIGKNASTVSDVIRGTGANNDADFQSTLNVYEVNPAIKSNFDLSGRFNDNPASPSMNLLVTHKAYAWTNSGDEKYVIVEYSIKNNGTVSHVGMYAGLCFDWDIQAYANNKADQDLGLKLGYVYNTDPGGLWAGVKLLTQTPFIHYAIDNVSGGNGGIDPVSGGIGTDEKYITLSTNRPQAGVAGSGNDVLDVVSTGPFTIAPGDSQIVAFAIIAGDDLSDIQQSASNAQIKYNGVLSVSENQHNYNAVLFPNPASDITSLNFYSDCRQILNVEIVDLTGKTINTFKFATVAGINKIDLNVSSIANGVYTVVIKSSKSVIAKKLVLN